LAIYAVIEKEIDNMQCTWMPLFKQIKNLKIHVSVLRSHPLLLIIKKEGVVEIKKEKNSNRAIFFH
jgi:hypothetical protein